MSNESQAQPCMPPTLQLHLGPKASQASANIAEGWPRASKELFQLSEYFLPAGLERRPGYQNQTVPKAHPLRRYSVRSGALENMGWRKGMGRFDDSILPKCIELCWL